MDMQLCVTDIYTPVNSRINPIYKRSELKYLINFRNKNQMRFSLRKEISFKSKMDNKVCLN
jgi:ribosomal protein S24E